jgi:hypothetical protein
VALGLGRAWAPVGGVDVQARRHMAEVRPVRVEGLVVVRRHWRCVAGAPHAAMRHSDAM